MPISKINTSSITDNSVTAGKIVAGAVDADIAAGSIDTAQIADDAVTADKLANAINTSIAVGSTANTTANAALPKAGGTMTGALDVNAAATLGGGTDEIQIIGGGGTARVDAIGGNTNVNLSLSTKGTGKVYFWRGGYGGTQMALLDSDGLKFNGDTAAANALDDYEEGTWTPVVSGASIAASQILGTYTKIGNRVLFQCYIYGNITSNGTTPAKITGLPFTTGANGLNQTVFYVSHNTAVDGESIGGFMSNNNTQLIFLNRHPNNVAASWINGNGKEVMVGGTYFTDS